jgi:hypothetical protein
MDWKKLLGSITASVDEELRLRNAYLAAENRVLRQQITGRVHLTDHERKALAEIGQQLGKKALAEIATIAQPETILAWRRLCVGHKGEDSKLHTSVGRPRMAQEIEDLVVRMARENRSWGYDRIVGALANLGYTISDQTVGNILKRHSIPPAPERRTTTTWKEFLRTHIDILVATDFFTGGVWSRLKLVLSFLLVFVYIGPHTEHLADMTAALTTRCAHWSTAVARWIRTVIEHVLSWLLRCGHAARPPLLSACQIPDHHQALPHSRGQVILLSVRHPHPIRDGPARCPPQVSRLWRDDHRKAA